MTAYESFCIFNALKLHFTSESYNYFTYNGKTKTNINVFENRKDKYYFYKLAKTFHDKEEFKLFLISNFISPSSEKIWIGNFIDESAFDEFKKRKKILQSLNYVFLEDCKKLFEFNENPNELMKTDGDYPQILLMTMQNEIHLETLIIMNNVLNFFDIWNKKIKDNIVWPNFKMKCVKYNPFINYDKKKYEVVLREHIYKCIS